MGAAVSDRLRRARVAAGFKTATEFTDKFGIPQSTYALHEGGKRGLKDNVLKDYAEKLGVREPWLRYGEGPMKAERPGKSTPSAESEQTPGGARNAPEFSPRAGNDSIGSNVPEELRSHVRPAGALKAGAKDVPIRGYGKGGHGGYFIDQGVLIGMAYRPGILEDVPDAYAIEVWDHSMDPALKHGHLALVNPHKTVLPGNECVIVLKDGETLIKELVRRTEKQLVLKQHNPPGEIRIDQSKVKFIHLIVDSPRVRM